MGVNGRVEDVSGSIGLVIIRTGAQRRERAFVDDPFDVDDQGVEDVDVEERFDVGLRRQVALKKSYDAFPYASTMWGTRWNKVPLNAFSLQGFG